MVPAPVTTCLGGSTLKVVVRVPLAIAGELLTVTVYVPGRIVLGPPVPAGEQAEPVNVPGYFIVNRPLPLPSVVMVTTSQNGPPAPVGVATLIVTEYELSAVPC